MEHNNPLFEKHYLSQGISINRSIEKTLDLGWHLLSILPKPELDRVDEKILDVHYNQKEAYKEFNIDNRISVNDRNKEVI